MTEKSSKKQRKVLGLGLNITGLYVALTGVGLLFLPQVLLAAYNPTGQNMFEGGKVDFGGIVIIFLLSAMQPLGAVLIGIGLVLLAIGLVATSVNETKENKNG